jgi:hypothetical protein
VFYNERCNEAAAPMASQRGRQAYYYGPSNSTAVVLTP